jgi:hypothetical protein
MRNCFQAKVLAKYEAQYEVCDTCGYLHAHNPDWLDEAYSRAIANADTGLVSRNFTVANKLARVLYWLSPERGHGVYLDAAGGYGILTRIMRDYGFDFYWADKYCENLVAPGFEYSQDFGICSAVTAIEVFEHLIDPKTFIKEILDFSGAKTLIFTTELYEGDPPLPDNWWYYSFATGQHIGFFQRRTLQTLANQLGLHFSSANGIHIFSKEVVNENLLYIITSRFISELSPRWIRRKLGSKTMIDHQLMMQNIKLNS